VIRRVPRCPGRGRVCGNSATATRAAREEVVRPRPVSIHGTLPGSPLSVDHTRTGISAPLAVSALTARRTAMNSRGSSGWCGLARTAIFSRCSISCLARCISTSSGPGCESLRNQRVDDLLEPAGEVSAMSRDHVGVRSTADPIFRVAASPHRAARIPCTLLAGSTRRPVQHATIPALCLCPLLRHGRRLRRAHARLALSPRPFIPLDVSVSVRPRPADPPGESSSATPVIRLSSTETLIRRTSGAATAGSRAPGPVRSVHSHPESTCAVGALFLDHRDERAALLG